jgi:hypothetical protein
MTQKYWHFQYRLIASILNSSLHEKEFEFCLKPSSSLSLSGRSFEETKN